MSLEKDDPLSAWQARALVIGLSVMVAVGVALFGGFIPGLKPNYTPPPTLVLDGQPYYYSSVTLDTPNLWSNSTTPQAFEFHNVMFDLWVTNWGGISGGVVHGNGTETNGTAYSFVLGETQAPPVNATLFVSPDRVFAVSWPGGILGGPSVRLMVHA